MKRALRFATFFGTLALVVGLLGVWGSPSGAKTTRASDKAVPAIYTKAHPFVAAWIYVGAPSDAGWTHAQDVGRQAVKSYFGGRVKTLYKEDVPEGPQCAQVITELINEGAKIIFATSYGYQPSMVAAAKAHPTVLFEQATGTAMSKNLAEYYGAGEDGDYLSGMAAGAAAKVAKTNANKIGFVAPYAIPEVIREIDAFTMGARLMDPMATVRVVWTNTWFGPATERQAAESLVGSGVSVLGDGQDSPTTGEVAEANNIKWTGYDSNQERFAPKSWLTATTYNWGPYYIREVKAAMKGTWKSHFYYGGLGDHFVIMAPFGKSVAPATRTAILKKESAIVHNTFNPFSGPIYKQNGKLGVKKGVTLTVMQKYALNWFVKGVIGNPKG